MRNERKCDGVFFVVANVLEYIIVLTNKFIEQQW